MDPGTHPQYRPHWRLLFRRKIHSLCALELDAIFLESNFGMAADDAGYLSTLFDLAGFAGVVVAGYMSDKFFNGKRAFPSFLMLVGMMLGCAGLFLAGGASIFAFGACLALIGFMLFGPDSLLSGAEP